MTAFKTVTVRYLGQHKRKGVEAYSRTFGCSMTEAEADMKNFVGILMTEPILEALRLSYQGKDEKFYSGYDWARVSNPTPADPLNILK